MSLTPLLGALAQQVSPLLAGPDVEPCAGPDAAERVLPADTAAAIPRDAVLVCGYGDVGRAVCDALGGDGRAAGRDAVPFVAFDLDPSRVQEAVAAEQRVVYGDGASAELIRAAGVVAPRAIVVAYESPARRMDAIMRLRESYPSQPILVRASTASEAESLRMAGASRVVIEADELAARFGELLETDLNRPMGSVEPSLAAQSRLSDDF